MRQFNLATKEWEEQEDRPPSALRLLQEIYMDEAQPLHTRMRAASLAIAYETPKLAVTGYVNDSATFAQALDRAIARSREGKVLELSACDAGEVRAQPEPEGE